jgi:hypothetical protein
MRNISRTPVWNHLSGMALVFGGKDPAVKLHRIRGLVSGPPTSPFTSRMIARSGSMRWRTPGSSFCTLCHDEKYQWIAAEERLVSPYNVNE